MMQVSLQEGRRSACLIVHLVRRDTEGPVPDNQASVLRCLPSRQGMRRFHRQRDHVPELYERHNK